MKEGDSGTLWYLNRHVRLFLSVACGCLASALFAFLMFGAYRSVWPAYALAEPIRGYTLEMLTARLLVGASCAMAGGLVAAFVSGRRSASWWFGAIMLGVSLRPHLVTARAYYPAWYHLLYLGYIVPLAGLGGNLARRVRSHA